jgi:hypothetical protein
VGRWDQLASPNPFTAARGDDTDVDTHDRADTSMFTMQVDHLLERETGTDVGIDDEEFLEVG